MATYYNEVLKYLGEVENFLQKTKNDFHEIGGNVTGNEVKKVIQQVNKVLATEIEAILSKISEIRRKLDKETKIGEDKDLKMVPKKMPKKQ